MEQQLLELLTKRSEVHVCCHRHSGKNYALPKVWTVLVSDNVIFTLVSDCFFLYSIVVDFMFGHVFTTLLSFKPHFSETCWPCSPKCN